MTIGLLDQKKDVHFYELLRQTRIAFCVFAKFSFEKNEYFPYNFHVGTNMSF